MSRLQVGGLALSTDTGTIVTLIEFLGDCFDIDTDMKYFSVWHVRDSCYQVSHTGETVIEYGVEAKFLIPLGDDKGVEVHRLKEALKEINQ
ncbi:hypothetical protein [Acinetobacter pittii]|uniref:hypothetical protein n=1 Tax=Acinetobacter pittii TaxID=48296 RepID=UPI00300A62F5